MMLRTYKWSVVLNNYQLGSPYFKATRTDRIISKERLDSRHTKVIYMLDNNNDVDALERAFKKTVKREDWTLDELDEIDSTREIYGIPVVYR